jgi:hypothetical protein
VALAAHTAVVVQAAPAAVAGVPGKLNIHISFFPIVFVEALRAKNSLWVRGVDKNISRAPKDIEIQDMSYFYIEYHTKACLHSGTVVTQTNCTSTFTHTHNISPMGSPLHPVLVS